MIDLWVTVDPESFQLDFVIVHKDFALPFGFVALDKTHEYSFVGPKDPADPFSRSLSDGSFIVELFGSKDDALSGRRSSFGPVSNNDALGILINLSSNMDFLIFKFGEKG